MNMFNTFNFKTLGKFSNLVAYIVVGNIPITREKFHSYHFGHYKNLPLLL